MPFPGVPADQLILSTNKSGESSFFSSPISWALIIIIGEFPKYFSDSTLQIWLSSRQHIPDKASHKPFNRLSHKSGFVSLKTLYPAKIAAVVFFEKLRSSQEPVMAQVLEPKDDTWRGLGDIPLSGFGLKPEFAAFDPQLVLLDLSLPYRNGYHWCRVFRELSPVPIVFLSSAADNLNIVTAMDLGADDYIAKPFDLEVLAAKVQAILRRAYAYARPADLVDCGGGVMLDLGAGALKSEAGTVELTKNELRILQTLLAQRGRTVPRDALMTALWATDCFVDENTLTVNVARLRKKLETAGLPGLIRTKKGEGYCIE